MTTEREQLSLDFAAAAGARDDAIDMVARGNAEWCYKVAHVIESLARERAKFTADHIWKACAAAGIDPPREPRALGAAMTAATQAGICQPTPYFFPSRRRSRHAGPCRIWRSLIHDDSG